MEQKLSIWARDRWIVPPNQNAVGVRVAVVVADREITEHHFRDINTWEETLSVPGFTPVRRSKRVGEARHEIAMMSSGTRTDRDRMRTTFLSNRS